MKTFVSSFFLRCTLGLMLSAGLNLMAQAPAAPASGGGARTGGNAGGNAGRTNSGTTTNRTGTNATGTNTTTPAAATPGTNTTTNNPNATRTNATGTNAAGANANTPANRTNANPNINGTNPNGANTGTPASGTNGTNATGTNINGTTNATGTNANGTNTNGTNATGTNATGATNINGTNATGTNPNGNRTTGAANQSGVNGTSGNTSMPAGTVTSSGMISNFGANDFSLQGPTTSSPNATPSDFAFGPDTLFVDPAGNNIPRDRFFRRGGNVSATVYYTRSPNGSLIASKVMLADNQAAPTSAPVESAGTITEVSPGIMVIEQPGASDTPVRYVNNKTTNYVNENGEPVASESVKAGTPVKIFYTKVGDTLVASRVEVHHNDKSGLPKPPVPSDESTRPAKK